MKAKKPRLTAGLFYVGAGGGEHTAAFMRIINTAPPCCCCWGLCSVYLKEIIEQFLPVLVVSVWDVKIIIIIIFFRHGENAKN